MAISATRGNIIFPENPNGDVYLRDDGTFGSASLFDRYADATTTGTSIETLWTNMLAADTLDHVGDKVIAEYFGIFAANGNNKAFRMQFGGTSLTASSTFTQSGGGWEARLVAIREDSDTVRCISRYICNDQTEVFYDTVTSLDFTGTLAVVLQGVTSGGAGDLTAKLGYAVKVVAAVPDTTAPSVPGLVSFVADSETELTMTWSASTD